MKTKLLTESHDTVKVNLLIKLADICESINRDSAIYYLNKALMIARETDDPKYKAQIYTRIGSNYCFKGDYLHSLEYLDLAENIIIEYPNKAQSARIHYYKALVFLHLDKFQQANDHTAKALDLFRELNDLNMMRGIYTLYCYIFEGLDDLERSLEFSMKSYGVSVELQDTVKIAANLNNIGTRYFLLNSNDSALYYIRKAVVLNTKYSNKIWLAINYHNLADIFLDLNEVDSADYYIQKASTIYHDAGHLMNYYFAQEVKAKISLAKKDTLTAIEYYKSIIESPKHLENLKIKAIANNALFDIEYSRERYVEAINYYKAYNLFDDSLTKASNTSLLSVLELEMEFEKQKNHLELENKEIKLRSQQKNFFISIMAVVILLLGITVYFIYRLHKARSNATKIENQRIEEELAYKKREMTANVLSLMKKNEILAEISNSMLEVERQAVKPETKDAINKIAAKIRKTSDEEIWEEFNIRFKEVHIDFHSKLLRLYPDLSPSEQRLCAFLRMNMSTKDISELSGVDPRSINNTRSKVRKKMGLANDENLVSYLSKI
ncbi:MAG: hypothetical protein ABFS32_21970 [Bacteroidota bacterium]